MYAFFLCLLLAHAPLHAHAHTTSKSSFRLVKQQRLDTARYTVRSSVLELASPQTQQTQVTIHDSAATPAPAGARAERLGHLLALYSHPSDAATVPLTFLNISLASSTYVETGKAVLPLKLINVRQDLVLRLISHSAIQPSAVLAESTVIRNTVAAAPTQVHLAQHANGHSLIVQWVSGSSTPQQLQYATSRWDPTTAAAAAALSSKAATLPTAGGVKQVRSTSLTYTADMMCGPPASSFGWLEPHYMHLAVIPGSDVGYDQQLYYRVGSDATGWSQVFIVTSAPSSASVAAGKASFTFLVFNDVGQENAVLFNNTCPPYCPAGWQFEGYTANSTKLARHLEAEADARMGLLVGDLAYADGYLVDWEFFGMQFEQAFSRWPLMVAIGNHEVAATGEAAAGDAFEDGGECGVPYTYRYYTPAWTAADSSSSQSVTTKSNHQRQHTPQQPSPASTWQQAHVHTQTTTSNPTTPPFPTRLATHRSFYSFDMGGVHFLVLDSESPSNPDSPQGRFVAADLAQVDRSRTPWLVAALHRMVVAPSTDKHDLINMARLQRDLEGLFLQYKVDLVLQGHEHAYSRSCPYANGKCAASGSTTATIKSDSSRSSSSANRQPAVETVHNPPAPIYILAGHAGAGFTHSFPVTLPDYMVFAAQDRNGYLRVTATSSSLTAVSVSSDDGQVMDGVEIVRPAAVVAS